MTHTSDAERVSIDGATIEIRRIPGRTGHAPTIVFLHDGLGCVATWRDVPERIAAGTGCAALVYSRAGYGGSSPIVRPRPLLYMEREAERVLPTLLAAADVRDPILFGHSDGATIALVYAALAPVRALVLEAPHVMCEDLSVRSVVAAREEFTGGDLRARLQRWHGDNVDDAFYGWNDAWLDPRFRSWSIARYLPLVRAPTLLVQGSEDAFGTAAQLRAVERGVAGPVETHELPGCGHAPHREAADRVAALAIAFVRRFVVG
jgi:pimeloyl-ACP methyl ester carboxylesterase